MVHRGVRNAAPASDPLLSPGKLWRPLLDPVPCPLTPPFTRPRPHHPRPSGTERPFLPYDRGPPDVDRGPLPTEEEGEESQEVPGVGPQKTQKTSSPESETHSVSQTYHLQPPRPGPFGAPHTLPPRLTGSHGVGPRWEREDTWAGQTGGVG